MVLVGMAGNEGLRRMAVGTAREADIDRNAHVLKVG